MGFRLRVSKVFTALSSRYDGVLAIGLAAGSGFELFKIYFSFNGVNYYSVFKKKQLQKELDEFEKGLIDLDKLIEGGVPRKL